MKLPSFLRQTSVAQEKFKAWVRIFGGSLFCILLLALLGYQFTAPAADQIKTSYFIGGVLVLLALIADFFLGAKHNFDEIDYLKKKDNPDMDDDFKPL